VCGDLEILSRVTMEILRGRRICQVSQRRRFHKVIRVDPRQKIQTNQLIKRMAVLEPECDNSQQEMIEKLSTVDVDEASALSARQSQHVNISMLHKRG
jgi:hypothetical protein